MKGLSQLEIMASTARWLAVPLVLSQLVLPGCRGGPTANDVVNAGAKALLIGGAGKTAQDVAGLVAIEGLTDTTHDHKLAQEGTPQVNVYAGNGNTTNQPQEAPYDWDHILMDPRMTDMHQFGRRIVFSLPFRGKYKIRLSELFIANSNGKDVQRLTYTPLLSETNPRFTDNGNRIAFDVEHHSVFSDECKVKDHKDWFCLTHQAYSIHSHKPTKKVMDVPKTALAGK